MAYQQTFHYAVVVIIVPHFIPILVYIFGVSATHSVLFVFQSHSLIQNVTSSYIAYCTVLYCTVLTDFLLSL